MIITIISYYVGGGGGGGGYDEMKNRGVDGRRTNNNIILSYA